MVIFLFLAPCVIYCAMTFYYFLCYCIFFFFLHTYPYKHVHMLCVCFFKLPHSFDVSHISLLLFGMKVGLQASPEAQLSYQKRELDVFLQYVLPWHGVPPLCTLKRPLFQSFVCCGSSVLKALPTCLYVGQSRRLGSPRMSLRVVLSLFLSGSVGLDSISSQVRGT